MMSNKPFAEVIESSLQGWLAQSWQWNCFPVFGSLVTIKTKKRHIFGIVHQIQTGSMDPMRHPFPYQKTEEELLQEQPQIFEFLKTTFSCLTLGYCENEKIIYLLAPEPPQIHSFVTMASKEASIRFFSNEQYLHLIFNASHQLFNIDELLLAMLKQQALFGLLNEAIILHFVETFSLLTGNDYRRLKLFLQRVEPNIPICSKNNIALK
ncbi:hypothetical protein E3J79_01255 [Candidatus Dependentiae bacterium]|nr:MAG: hypothetical protein E3J79_01255 [Candidatus Dependentiae bacterium]